MSSGYSLSSSLDTLKAQKKGRHHFPSLRTPGEPEHTSAIFRSHEYSYLRFSRPVCMPDDQQQVDSEKRIQ